MILLTHGVTGSLISLVQHHALYNRKSAPLFTANMLL